MVQTVARALSVREPLWQAVTAVLPIVVSTADPDPGQLREQYREVFAALGMSASSERDLALLAGAVETAKWVGVAAEMAGVDPQLFWQRYLARMQA